MSAPDPTGATPAPMPAPTPAPMQASAPTLSARARAWRTDTRPRVLTALGALPSWLRPRVPTDTWEPQPATPATAGAREGEVQAPVQPHVAWRRVAVGLAAVAGVAALFVAVPEADAQAGVLDTVRNQYAAMTRTWIGPMSVVGRRLFAALAGIEFTVSAFLWLGRSDDLTEVARRFLLKFILISFLLMLLSSASFWLPPIVNSLAVAGQRAGVMAVAPGPSAILDVGLTFAFDDIGNANIPWSFEALGAVLFKLITQVIVVVSFAMVAAQLLLVWVESYIALGGGVLFLGFGGFRATAGFAENYLNYLVYCGVKLFVFYLVVGLGMAIVQSARVMFVSNVGFDMRMAGNVLALTITFALITLRVPGNAAARIAGGAHLGIGNALRSL